MPQANVVATQLRLLSDHFKRAGGTAEAYLASHLPRYMATKSELERLGVRQGRLLDIGAHWLHQSLLYALDGYSVTAADLGAVIDTGPVQEVARQHGIALIVCDDLERPGAFRALPDDSFDAILFTEIIEHITFNPLAMWAELLRLLRPGGMLVVTTPNPYAFGGRAWQLARLLRGHGLGVSVPDILGTPTYGHHWKEYSLAELKEYFALLSPDLQVSKAGYLRVPDHGTRRSKRIAKGIIHALPMMRTNLFVALTLQHKRHGITARAAWR